MKLVERIGYSFDQERWLAQGKGGQLHVAYVFSPRDHEWRDGLAVDAKKWIGFRHPRVVEMLDVEIDPREQRVVITVANDRGPQFTLAAAQLDPAQRESWAIAQVIALCDALGDMGAHLPGFFYGRIEPDRVFVDITGRAHLGPVLWPSGARQPRNNVMGAGVITGTVASLSPEQVRGEPTTPATDVFSMATLLQEAITGTHPFGSNDSMFETLERVMNVKREPFASSIAGVDAVLAKAFAVKADRFATARELGMALYECLPDAGDFDLVTSDQIAAWWPTAPQVWSDGEVFAGRCAKRWDELAVRPGGDDTIRDCGTCRQPVTRVRTVEDVLPLVGRACIAFKP